MGQLRGVNRCRDRAIPVGSQRDVVDAKSLDAVLDSAGNRINILATGHVSPEADPDQAPRLGNQRHGLVTDVTGTGAVPIEAGVTDDKGITRCHAQSVAHRGFTAVGHIDDDPFLLHVAHCLLTEWRQPGLRFSVERAAKPVIEEVLQAHHAKACVIQLVDIVQLTIERMGPFGTQQRSDHRFTASAPGQ